MSGIRPWIGRISSLAAVVTMVNVPNSPEMVGFCQRSHKPAKATGA